MQVTKIAASTRNDNGKGASRRFRAQGKLPAVTYGPGIDPVLLTVSPEDVAHVLTSDRGINSVVELDIDGKCVKAMIGEYQYHPLTRKLLHADFIQVKDDQKVDVNVPLRLTGKSKGVVMGGKLGVVFREVPLRCLTTAIPAEVVHDITNLELDQTLSAGELDLPEGVEILLPEKRTLAVVAMDRRAKAATAEEQSAEGEK
jgi:large subunit ribosomal protein L25